METLKEYYNAAIAWIGENPKTTLTIVGVLVLLWIL
jgi:hypothetical protein